MTLVLDGMTTYAWSRCFIHIENKVSITFVNERYLGRVEWLINCNLLEEKKLEENSGAINLFSSHKTLLFLVFIYLIEFSMPTFSKISSSLEAEKSFSSRNIRSNKQIQMIYY